MRVVVNHLTLREPLPAAVVEAAQRARAALLEAGGTFFHLVAVDETHAMLVIGFPDAHTEQRVTESIGGPFMREHVVPLLDGPTRRTSGEVLV